MVTACSVFCKRFGALPPRQANSQWKQRGGEPFEGYDGEFIATAWRSQCALAPRLKISALALCVVLSMG